MKKTIITLLALCGVASAADVTKDDFGDNLNRVSISLDDVATSFSSGTFAVSFEAESSYALDLNLQMGDGIKGGESFYISVSGNNTYLSITAPNLDLMNSMVMLPAEYRGSFLLQCVNNNGFVITLSHFDEGTQLFTPIHEVTTNCTFPSSLNTATFNVGTSNSNSSSPVSELRIWEGIVTETEMANPPAALSPVVPEPTTASLSLLALAGLAARRRRK